MTIRFQADEDLRQAIVTGLARREPAIDFRTPAEAGFSGLPDPEVLAQTARAGRILVSHDARTMPRHFGDFITLAESPGVLIIPQHLPTAEAVDELLLIWSATDASEWTNRICRLPL